MDFPCEIANGGFVYALWNDVFDFRLRDIL
jgi:hypothetical protein